MIRRPLLVALLAWAVALPARGEIVRLTVVHTNDIHGGINPSHATYMNREFPPRIGGAASMATFLQSVRARVEKEGGHFLMLDAGDTFQGTPVGTLTKGRAVVDFMNAAGYDALALGNHDFDEGKENCQELVRRADFPVLAANLFDESTGEIVDWVEPWIIKDYGPLRVGIIGLITPETENMSFPANVAGLDFVPMAPVTRESVREIREQGVDVIFAVGHVGIPYDPEEHLERVAEEGWPAEDEPRSTAMDVAHHVSGLDAFFCGHIHKGFDEPWSMPNTHTLLFQTYGRGSGAGIVTFTIDTDTDQILDYELWTERGYLVTFFEDQFWPEEETARTIAAEVEKAEEGMDRIIGHTTEKFTRGNADTPMGNAVCDAMLEETGAEFAFQNLGGIRDELPAGTITPRDVFQVLPFGNKLMVFQMSGVLLKEVVETRISENHSGLHIAGGRVVFNKTRENYDRLVSFEVAGEPWDPDRTYRVVTTDFLAKGNSDLKMLPEVPEELKTYTGKMTREALEAWIARHSPVSPVVDGRWIQNDKAEMSPELEAALRRVPTP